MHMNVSLKPAHSVSVFIVWVFILCGVSLLFEMSVLVPCLVGTSANELRCNMTRGVWEKPWKQTGLLYYCTNFHSSFCSIRWGTVEKISDELRSFIFTHTHTHTTQHTHRHRHRHRHRHTRTHHTTHTQHTHTHIYTHTHTHTTPTHTHTTHTHRHITQTRTNTHTHTRYIYTHTHNTHTHTHTQHTLNT